jgi:hypothetical protein
MLPSGDYSGSNLDYRAHQTAGWQTDLHRILEAWRAHEKYLRAGSRYKRHSVCADSQVVLHTTVSQFAGESCVTEVKVV